MKKIIAIALSVVMLVSVLSVSVFADAGDTNIIIEIGNVFGELAPSAEVVEGSKSGEYTLSATLNSSCLSAEDSSFIAVKTVAGNNPQLTALPDGTVVTVTAVDFDGTKVEFDPELATKTITNGVFNGNDGVCLMFKMGGINAFTGDLPTSFKTVTITFTVENPEDASAEAEAEPEAAPEETAPEAEPEAAPEETAPEAEPETAAPAETTPAPATGIALAVLPMVIAAAAVVISKKH